KNGVRMPGFDAAIIPMLICEWIGIRRACNPVNRKRYKPDYKTKVQIPKSCTGSYFRLIYAISNRIKCGCRDLNPGK
ncbi:MAG: hypothetical protein KAH57_01485, partial [Thermoplasmata archaeon]|nr:hypothetical protein [Thermoplasmata archaeon]